MKKLLVSAAFIGFAFANIGNANAVTSIQVKVFQNGKALANIAPDTKGICDPATYKHLEDWLVDYFPYNYFKGYTLEKATLEVNGTQTPITNDQEWEKACATIRNISESDKPHVDAYLVK